MPFSRQEHFTRVEAILGGTLYFPTPVSFNDPFEMSPILAVLKAQADRFDKFDHNILSEEM